MKSEFEFIERLKRLIPLSLQGAFPIGDDAAIVSRDGDRSLLFTTDVIVEDVDFKMGKGGATPEAIGRKALAVNLSDLAAMGGRPLAFVAAFGIPPKISSRWLERMAKGMVRLAKQYGTQWVGGDLSRSEKLFVSVALLGEQETAKILKRSGAREGDLIYVTGTLGGSLEGRHLTFTPRLREAEYLVENFSPTSAIDVSDGFIQDLEHLLRASQVGAQVGLDRIPISRAAQRKSRGLGRKALESALTDGEDFELLFTLPANEAVRLEAGWKKTFPKVPLTWVGMTGGRPGRVEWRQNTEKLKKLWFRKKGFRHF